ncbi:MAG: FmdB family transcriptional regulator [Planctomycetota bacterium]
MPTYVYETVTDDGSPGERFELTQRMSDAALTTHPTTGEPVRRVPMAPNIGGDYTDVRERSTLSDANLDRLGFTKYERSGDGQMAKKFGKGPGELNA